MSFGEFPFNSLIHVSGDGPQFRVCHRNAAALESQHSTVNYFASVVTMAQCAWQVANVSMPDVIRGNQLQPWKHAGIPVRFAFILKQNPEYLFVSSNKSRSTHELIDVDGYLFALGGNDGASSLNTGTTHFHRNSNRPNPKRFSFSFFNAVEKYDPQADEWSTVSSMFLRRTSVGAAVLECFNLERGLVQTTNL